MELPKYAVPESLLPRQAVQPSRGDNMFRAPTNDIDDSGHYNKTTGKRRRTSPGSAALQAVSGRTELSKNTVPESFLPRKAVRYERGDHTLRAPTNEIDDPGRYNTATGKRQKTSPGFAPLQAASGRMELPRYAVPEYLISTQTSHPSRGDHASREPFSETDNRDRYENPTTVSYPEPTISVQSRPDLECLALNTQYEAPNQCPFPPSTDVMRMRTRSCHSLDESSDLTFQTAGKDPGNKYDSLFAMSPESFLPTPAMTDAWGEVPTPDLSWNSTAKVPILLEGAMPGAETDAAVAEATPEIPELMSDREVQYTHSTANTSVLPSKGVSQLSTSASTGDRLSHVLKAVTAAGFSSLDNAVLAYYIESSKDDEWLKQEQRLSRIRRLPVLLKELHLAAQGWGQWQRRGFQEQIIKSTEDILVAELEDHLAARQFRRHNSNAGDGMDIEAELPNTWTLLTSLTTKYNTIASKLGQSDVPILVTRFLAAGTNLGT